MRKLSYKTGLSGPEGCHSVEEATTLWNNTIPAKKIILFTIKK